MLYTSTSGPPDQIPIGGPRITLPLLRLPRFISWAARAASRGSMPRSTRSNTRRDVGPYTVGSERYACTSSAIMSSGENPRQRTRERATARACSVSSVNVPGFRPW